jgi:DNA-directed RNA polymerase subunit RPC12/RpoP
MVKVISTEPHPTVVKQVVCRNCGATLEYVPADVKSHTYSDYGGGIDVTCYIKCPPCGHEVTVKG